MSKKQATKIKERLASLIVLLLFAFPVAWTVQWGMQVFSGPTDRKVFSEKDVASFSGDDCGGQSDKALEPFSEPIVTVSFDDGWESSYSEGFEILEKCKIKATHYILGDNFDEPLYLSEEQVHSLKAAGHEIAAHSMTHANLTTLDIGSLDWELEQTKTILNQKFGTAENFAVPLGESNPQVVDRISKNYRTNRNTLGNPRDGLQLEDINMRSTFNPYNINAFTVRRSTTLAEMQQLIDYTIKNNGWLVITYHQVDAENPSEYAVSPKVLREHMELIRASRIRTGTTKQVMDSLSRPRSAQ
jgi:peptidoglycan/xylan/chitin deacetylase (PgdA/CDA1 family)